MFLDAIKNFPKQFEYDLKIENKDNLEKKDKFIVAGMGGSHLAADLLKEWDPSIDLVVHKNYGLPALPEENLKERLFIASSYSGNTEETIDALETAISKNLPTAVISTGGKLVEIAKKKKLPYVQIPNTNIQPRSAAGFGISALLKIMGKEKDLTDAKKAAFRINPDDFNKAGKKLADKTKNLIPIIYSSARNEAIANNWKIRLNETGKIPSFYNVFPELNHNEMTSFKSDKKVELLSEKFFFIILKDKDDHSRVIKRMEVMEKIFSDLKLKVEVIDIEGQNIWEKIISSLTLADWFSYYTASNYGMDAEEVELIEKFKLMLD